MRGWRAGWWVLRVGLIGLAGSHGTLAACGDALPTQGRLVAEAGGLQVLAVPRPWPVPVGQQVVLDIVLCMAPSAAPGALPGAAPASALPQDLQVDADMPAHRHGMNYRPTVRALGDGRFVADGLLFHMPGRWRLLFAAGDARKPLRLAAEFNVE